MKQLETTKPVNTKIVIMAVAMTAFIMNSAYAASPKIESVVTGSMITLGDVFDGVTDNAGYVLAPAPEPGKTMTLNINDLQRISNAFNLDWKAQNSIVQVVVRRDAREIDRYAIEAALQEKLAGLIEGGKFDLHLTDKNIKIFLPPDMAATVEVDDVTYDKARGEFHAMLSAPSSDNPVVKKEVRGRIYAVTSVPVLKTALRSGDVIGVHDIVYVDAPEKDINTGVIVSAENLIGMTPRRGIAAGKLMTPADIEQPVAIKKGDLVRMTLTSGAMSLTVQGKALESGAVGENVRVINVSSNQVVEGIVTGAQSISVEPPATFASNI